jgi:hypothetical protein
MIVVGFGPRKLPVFIDEEEDVGGTIATLRHKEPWLERAWWHNTESYTIQATLLEINGKELIDPPSNKLSVMVVPNNVRVHASLRWAKKLKVEASSIFINALRILRSGHRR